MALSLKEETARRRTFAIIASRCRKNNTHRKITSMEEQFNLLELLKLAKIKSQQHPIGWQWKRAGISITSAALQFEYKDFVLNLLDTPGHEDFSKTPIAHSLQRILPWCSMQVRVQKHKLIPAIQSLLRPWNSNYYFYQQNGSTHKRFVCSS